MPILLSSMTNDNVPILPFRNPELLKLVHEHGLMKSIPAGTEILYEGQSVRYIPFVLSGLVRVFTRYEEKELLLYHIAPNESCIMSLAVSLRNEPSKINAVAEENSQILLLPVQRALEWLKEYPELTMMFFQEFYKRYSDLVDTIRQFVFTNLESRLLDFLKTHAEKQNGRLIKIPHREIASDLGTAREVVSRILKKLEKSGIISQSKEGIEILK